MGRRHPEIPHSPQATKPNPPQRLEDFISKIPESKVVELQNAMAALAPRLVLQLEDGEHDSLQIILDRIAAL